MTNRRPRRLAAILMLDIVGFSVMMGRDDEATTTRVVGFHRSIGSLVEDHRGRVVDTAGDSVFARFDSIVEAVDCAAAIQRMLAAETGDDPIMVRIGLHFGDVLVEGDDLYGEGVNIAARLEELAPSGGIAVSEVVYQEVRGRLPFTDAGSHTLKNIDRRVRVFRVSPTAFGFPETSLAAADAPDPDLTIEGLDEGIAAVRDIAAIVRQRITEKAAEPAGGERRKRLVVPRERRTVTDVLSSGVFWVQGATGALLLASRPTGWTANGLYPLLGAVMLAGAIGALAAAVTRMPGVATLVTAVGLGFGAFFLGGTASRAIAWILAAAIGGPAIARMIKR